jgi:glycosyltransferase involved in cell wall biosynthesis
MSSVSISAVIPVYNEATALTDTLKRADRVLRETKVVDQYEIILVDDGSTDGAFGSIGFFSNARTVKHDGNRGYGAALKTGIAQARYPLIMICDADGSYDIEAFPRMLAAWAPARMVVASRDHIVYTHAAWVKRCMRGVFSLWLLLLTFRFIDDVNSGFRLFEKERVLPVLGELSDKFSFTTGLTLDWILSSKQIVYVPTLYVLRKGESKVRFFRDSLRVFSQTVRFVFKRNPARLGIPAAILLVLAWSALRSLTQ